MLHNRSKEVCIKCIDACERVISASQVLIDVCAGQDAQNCGEQVGKCHRASEACVKACQDLIAEYELAVQESDHESERKSLLGCMKAAQKCIESCKEMALTCSNREVVCIDTAVTCIAACRECAEACKLCVL